jgi:hypothetical protein
MFRLPTFLNHHLFDFFGSFGHFAANHFLHAFDVLGSIATGREDRLARLEQDGGVMDVQSWCLCSFVRCQADYLAEQSGRVQTATVLA